MYLDELFHSAPHTLIEQISTDSRMPMKNAIFFCLEGVVYNGHNFYKEAIQNGAVAIVYSEEIDISYNVVFLKVSNTTESLCNISNRFYNYPTKAMECYLVSGCYGKAMVNHILYSLLSRFEKSGFISNHGIQDGNSRHLNKCHTLPILDTMRWLKKMNDNEVKNVVLESSVIDLYYGKMDCIVPASFIYTTTGKEAMEYRECNKEYEKNLINYCASLSEDTMVILNRDDEMFDELAGVNNGHFLSYGMNDEADFKISGIELRKDGSSFNVVLKDCEKIHIETCLVGISSVYNITACLCALEGRFDLKELVDAVKDIKPMDGCCCPVNEGQNFNVLIDSANNFQTIEKVYQYASGITETNRIIAVIPVNYMDNALKLQDLMEESNRYCSLVILTDGDSYGKDISSLLEKAENYLTCLSCIIRDRESAIEAALDACNSGDTVLLLGKGEEDYINGANGRIKYKTDKKIAEEYLKKRNKLNLEDDFEL